MNCSASHGYQNVTDSTYYRVLVNQSPQTLPGCFDGPLESCSAQGMRDLLHERGAMFGSFGAACDVDYTNSTDVLSIYQRNVTGQTVGK
jgi:acid phosphatase